MSSFGKRNINLHSELICRVFTLSFQGLYGSVLA
nr:MAG TPA: hypothetical protein [Caudoviricetes sp.]